VGANKVAFLAADSASPVYENRLNFYLNGAVSSGPIRTDQTLAVGRHRIRFWRLLPVSSDGLLFYDNGGVIGGELFSDTRLRVGSRDILFRAGRTCPLWREDKDQADIGFHRDGSVAYGYIAEPLPLALAQRTRARMWYGTAAITLAPGQKVRFNRAGDVLFEQEYSGFSPYRLEGAEPLRPCIGKVASVCSCATAPGACTTELLVSSGTMLQVFVDGRECGWTPVLVRGLAPGPHRIAAESDLAIAERVDSSATDSIRAARVVARLVTADSLPDSSSGFYHSELLQSASAYQVLLECNRPMHLHFSDQDTLRSGYAFDHDTRRAAAAQKHPAEAANLGWHMFSDESDTAAFRAFTVRAMALLGTDGDLPGNQWMRCNMALVHLLAGRTAAAMSEYRTALAIEPPGTLTTAIAGDLRVVLDRLPYLADRVDSISAALGIAPAP
jgi:hypothetical protein